MEVFKKVVAVALIPAIFIDDLWDGLPTLVSEVGHVVTESYEDLLCWAEVTAGPVISDLGCMPAVTRVAQLVAAPINWADDRASKRRR